jgi:hypothetical protein
VIKVGPLRAFDLWRPHSSKRGGRSCLRANPQTNTRLRRSSSRFALSPAKSPNEASSSSILLSSLVVRQALEGDDAKQYQAGPNTMVSGQHGAFELRHGRPVWASLCAVSLSRSQLFSLFALFLISCSSLASASLENLEQLVCRYHTCDGMGLMERWGR